MLERVLFLPHGVAATSGSCTTHAPDNRYTSLSVAIVAKRQSQVTIDDIVQATNAAPAQSTHVVRPGPHGKGARGLRGGAERRRRSTLQTEKTLLVGQVHSLQPDQKWTRKQNAQSRGLG